MKRKSFIALLIIMVSLAQAQPPATPPHVVSNIDWITYTSQRGNVSNGPTSIDANQNVYSTGYTGNTTPAYNILTQKRDNLGNIVFSVQYDNGGFDKGNAIKIHGVFTYVAGVSYSTSGNNDGILLCYNSTGSLVWQYRFDNTSQDDEFMDVKTDAAQNAYVTAKSMNGSGNYDIVTKKIDSSGNPIWTNTFAGTSNLDDAPVGVVIIGGYVYVAGNTIDATTGKNWFVRQIDISTGASGWTKQINGVSNANDALNAVTISGADIIICGEIDDTGNLDACTIRLDGSTGNIVYQTNYDFAGTNNRAAALVRDSTGNIASVGVALNGSIYEYHTQILDSLGNPKTVNIESTGLTSLSVDPRIACDTIAHHFYVCGEAMKTTKDMFVYQITPSGNTTWREYIDGQNSDIDAATGLAVNGIGVVYLCGLAKNTTGVYYDFTTAKISQTPVYFPPDFNNEPTYRQFGFLFNKGQLFNTNNQPVPEVSYYTESGSSLFYIKENSYSIVHQHLDTAKTNSQDSLTKIDVSFSERSSITSVTGFDAYTDPTNFYQTNIPNGITGVEAYKRMMVPNIYPDIDLHYYSNQNGVKYYFVVKPGGNPNLIQHNFSGASSTQTNSAGELVINSLIGKTTFDKSDAYQVVIINNTVQIVPLSWQASWVNVGTNSYKFSIGTYTNSLPLVIQVDQGNSGVATATVNNPTWSTYYGKSGFDGMYSCDADNNGFMYATGVTANQSFPAQNSVFGANGGGTHETFLFKFTKFGEPQWRTIYGGDGPDQGYAVNSDDPNFVYFGGLAGDPNYAAAQKTSFPTQFLSGATNKLTSVNGIGQKDYGFIGKINKATGLRVWVSLFGDDVAPTWTSIRAIDVDPNGNLYIGGFTQSQSTFPIVTPNTGCTVFSKNIVGTIAGFVAKFNSGNTLVWSTTFGAENDVSSVEDIKVNSIGELHITGYTAGSNPTDFPLKKEFSSDVMNTYAGGANDAFVAKFASCLELKWSTLYGGSGDDKGQGIELAQTNVPDGVPAVLTSVYVCGITKSTNFPYQSNSNTNSINDNTLNGTTDGFLAQFDNNHLSAWSTYVGDANNETLNKLEFGGTGVLYVIGESSSPSFVNLPVSGIYNQSTLGGSLTTNNRDACILAFNKNTNHSTMWSTFYGGKSPIGYPGSEDYSYGIAISNNVVYICGQTYSQNNFPLFADLVNHPTAYLQTVLGSGQDIYQDGFLATIEVTGTPLKVEEMQNQIEEMGIYPNPSSGTVVLKLKQNSGKRKEIEVYDLQGKKVFQTSIPDIGDVPVLLNLSHLINGLYLIKVSGDGNSTTKKLIIGK